MSQYALKIYTDRENKKTVPGEDGFRDLKYF